MRAAHRVPRPWPAAAPGGPSVPYSRLLGEAQCGPLVEAALEANRPKDPDAGKVFGKGMRRVNAESTAAAVPPGAGGGGGGGGAAAGSRGATPAPEEQQREQQWQEREQQERQREREEEEKECGLAVGSRLEVGITTVRITVNQLASTILPCMP